MHNDVRKLTEGAMIAAVMGVLLLIDRQMAGLLLGYFLFILPLPMVLYSARYGMKNSMIVFVAIMILSLMFGSLQTIFYMFAESLIGLCYGTGIYHKRSRSMILAMTLVIGAVVEVFAMIVLASVFGFDIAGEIAAYSDLLIEMDGMMGLGITSMVNLEQFVIDCLVIAAVMTGVLEGAVTHMLSQMMLKRLHFVLEPPKALKDMYMPKWAGYAPLVGVVVYFYTAMNPMEEEMMQIVLQAIGMASYLFLIVMGIIAGIVYVQVCHPKLSRWIYGLIVLMGVLFGMFMCVAGFLYITTNLHSLLMKGKDGYES